MATTTTAMRGLLLAGAVLFIAACAPTQPKPQPAQQSAQAETQIPEDQDAECKAKGGALQPVCRLGRVTCIVRYSDAGKACTDGSQCESQKCLADVTGPRDQTAPVNGQCKAKNDPCGCTTSVENGKLGVGICVD